MPVILQLIQPYLKLHPKKVLGVLGAVSEHVIHIEELRLLVHDDAGIRRNRNLAVREGIERIDGLVRRHVVREMNQDFHLVRGQVVNFLYLDLALVLCLEDGIDDNMGCFTIRYLADSQCVFVYFVYLRPDFHNSSPLSFHIF